MLANGAPAPFASLRRRYSRTLANGALICLAFGAPTPNAVPNYVGDWGPGPDYVGDWGPGPNRSHAFALVIEIAIAAMPRRGDS